MPHSKAQVRAAYAAAGGSGSMVGMPKKVALEIIDETHARGGTAGLPERAHASRAKGDGGDHDKGKRRRRRYKTAR